MYSVKVKPDYRHSTATVGGRMFRKSGTVVVVDSDMTDEIKNSPILDVKRVRARKRAPKAPEVEKENEE